MLSKETFLQVLATFSVNFGFKFYNDEEATSYKLVIYDKLKNIVDDYHFKKRADSIILNTSSKDWNDAYKYTGGKPSAKDWIEAFEMKPQWIKKDEYYIEPNTGANCVKQIMVKVGNQLTIKE